MEIIVCSQYVRRRCRRRRDALMSEKKIDVFRVGENLLACTSISFSCFQFSFVSNAHTNAHGTHAHRHTGANGKIFCLCSFPIGRSPQLYALLVLVYVRSTLYGHQLHFQLYFDSIYWFILRGDCTERRNG